MYEVHCYGIWLIDVDVHILCYLNKKLKVINRIDDYIILGYRNNKYIILLV
jgi:hypothetical protein